MKTYTSSLLIAPLALLFACGGPQEQQQAATPEDPETIVEETTPAADGVMEKDGITLTKVCDHHNFSEPTLTLDSPGDADGLAAGTVPFKFTVTGEDYTLGNQTPDASETMCANSAKGQHIHFIVNNSPYMAHYEAEFDAELGEGSNVVLAFLSRSYHESIKSPGAFVVKEFVCGDDEPQDLSGEHLFYSRPKGTYTGEFAQKVLLDFYLVNTSIAADGNKVKATINGTEFILDEWCPHAIEGLPMGENTVSIELIDAEGNPVPGPFNNSGDRTITLEATPEGDS